MVTDVGERTSSLLLPSKAVVLMAESPVLLPTTDVGLRLALGATVEDLLLLLLLLASWRLDATDMLLVSSRPSLQLERLTHPMQ